MAMSVFERTREIGVLRAVGWTGMRIAALIVSEAIGLCLIALAVGCGFGILCGTGLRQSQRALGPDQPDLHARNVPLGARVRPRRRALRALYPTWRAVRLVPIEALRHE